MAVFEDSITTSFSDVEWQQATLSIDPDVPLCSSLMAPPPLVSVRQSEISVACIQY